MAPEVSRADRKVLIVDDDHTILMMLYEILADEGFLVSTAKDGRLALASALDTPPDLILTDLMMPFMDGRTLASKLKQYGRTAQIPIVLMSASDQIQSENIFSAFIPKPFDIGFLVHEIWRHFT